MELKVIATMKCDLPEKFGLPRQSRLVDDLIGRVVFEKEYATAEAVRGLEEFSHLWLIWGFSATSREGWSPTVRPPRLGGNKRMGVFATRSPFRPNPLGLSCVRLVAVEKSALTVAGADLMDGTPIYDIKPYLSYADSVPDAAGGFTDGTPRKLLDVVITPEQESALPAGKAPALRGVLAQDPRPSYQQDPDRVYGLSFAGCTVRFKVQDGRLTVIEIKRM